MSGTAEQNGQYPEDHLPGTGLLFDETDAGQDAAAFPADSQDEDAGVDTSTGEITDNTDSPTPETGAEDHVFELTASEAASLITERAGKVSAVSFKAMAARGDAPKPSSWAGRTALWSLDDLEPWIEGLPSPEADEQEPEAEPEPEEETPEPEPAFRTVYDFYEGIYGPLYEHHDSSPGVLAGRGPAPIRWCKQWWNHESVMMRMTALWQAYEVAYAEGGGAVSTWMLDHADRHFDRIMAEGGPLSECRSDHGHNMTRYPVDPLPEGLNLDATTVQPAPTGDERKTA